MVDVAAELAEIDVHRVPQALVAAAPHGGGASGGAGAQQTGGGGRRGDEQLVLGGGDGRVNPEERTVDVDEVARLGVDAVNFSEVRLGGDHGSRHGGQLLSVVLGADGNDFADQGGECCSRD